MAGEVTYILVGVTKYKLSANQFYHHLVYNDYNSTTLTNYGLQLVGNKVEGIRVNIIVTRWWLLYFVPHTMCAYVLVQILPPRSVVTKITFLQMQTDVDISPTL